MYKKKGKEKQLEKGPNQMSLVTTESHSKQSNGEALKGFKQWKDIIRFQKIAVARGWRQSLGGSKDWTRGMDRKWLHNLGSEW